MNKIVSVLLSTLLLIAMVNTANAVPTVSFFNDRTVFESQLSSFTTIDFEGIVADNQWGNLETGAFSLQTSTQISGVDFSVSSGTMAVSGKNSPASGHPYDSALLLSNNSAPITADLTTAGSGFTAVGGFFGDINSAGSPITLSLFGLSGLLDQQNVLAADMGLGTPSNFYGWIIGGDEITSVTYNLNADWEGIDDFTFGFADQSAPVPEPSTWILLGSGLVGMIFLRRKQFQIKHNF